MNVGVTSGLAIFTTDRSLPRGKADNGAKSLTSDPVPTGLNREGDSTVVITWNDGSTSRWTAQRLRDTCPCATCREKRRDPDEGNEVSDGPTKKPIGLPVLSAAEARPLSITSMNPVGTYAYNIAFSDGHSSGIFTFDRLRDVSLNPEP